MDYIQIVVKLLKLIIKISELEIYIHKYKLNAKYARNFHNPL